MVDCRFEPEIFNMSLEHLKVLGNKENIKQKHNEWGHVKGPQGLNPHLLHWQADSLPLSYLTLIKNKRDINQILEQHYENNLRGS